MKQPRGAASAAAVDLPPVAKREAEVCHLVAAQQRPVLDDAVALRHDQARGLGGAQRRECPQALVWVQAGVAKIDAGERLPAVVGHNADAFGCLMQ